MAKIYKHNYIQQLEYISSVYMLYIYVYVCIHIYEYIYTYKYIYIILYI